MTSLKLAGLLFLSILAVPGLSQQLAHITIDNRGRSDVISFLVDENVFMDISKDGRILDWGVPDETPGPKSYPPKLARYMGREEYYPATADPAYAGKIKYIGRAMITYYTNGDDPSLQGKVKAIGTTLFDYFMSYEDAAYRGFIKNAGTASFTYYASFEDESYGGKIKSVNGVGLAYYGNFDDKAFRGKIKSIDRTAFSYYSSYDRPELRGLPKTPYQMTFAASIQFLIKNY